MAVNARQMNAMYVRLGFIAAAATALVTEQDMSDLHELSLLSDKEVDQLVKAVKSPGGANAGELVSMRAITNLKLACFYIRHCERTSRPCAPTSVTLAGVRKLRALRINEEAHSDPADTSAFSINGNNWAKTIEALAIFLSAHLGITKVPLGYVIRNLECAPSVLINPDPPCGERDSVYLSHASEMTARAPFFQNGLTLPPTEAFTTDNGAV